MRIALVGPTYPLRGGIAHYTTLLAGALAARHEVLFVSYAEGYPRLLFPGTTDRDPSRAAVTTASEPLLAPLKPWTWWRAARRIRAFGPDLILVQWWVPFHAPALAALSALTRSTAPTLFVCHNVLPHDGGHLLDRLLTRLGLRGGRGFLVHSATLEASLQRMLPGRPIRQAVLPDHAISAPEDVGGAAVENSRAAFAPPLPPEARTALFFGFVRPYKGLAELISAMALVVREVPAAHLAVAGEFWLPVAEFRRQAADLGIADRLHVLDRYVANEAIAGVFGLADVVVLPYVDATQSGVVTLAHRFGVPLVVTDTGGLAEAVIDGETGFVVPPRDSAALARAVAAVLGDPSLQARLAAGVAAARPRFGWGRHVDVIEDLARDVGVSVPALRSVEPDLAPQNAAAAGAARASSARGL